MSSIQLNNLRIASPCPVGWQNMHGDDRARFCDLCQLHVYNIEEMTTDEVQSLIASTEGRICARLYKRADGTVLTKDCPVGLRALRRRVSRKAAAVIAALVSLSATAFGQQPKKDDASQVSPRRIVRQKADVKHPRGLAGTVMDAAGAVVPNAKVLLTNVTTNATRTINTDETGRFEVLALDAGQYSLTVEAFGFKTLVVKSLDVAPETSVEVDLIFEEAAVLVGVLVDVPDLIDRKPGVVISGEYIRRLPF